MHASFLQLAHLLILRADACELLDAGKAIRDSGAAFTASSSINSTIVSSEQRTPNLKALPCFLSSPGAQSRDEPSDANSSIKQLLTPPMTCASPRVQRAREGRWPLSRTRCASVRACVRRRGFSCVACRLLVTCRLSLARRRGHPLRLALTPYACVRVFARAHVCGEPCRRGHGQGPPTPQQDKGTPSRCRQRRLAASNPGSISGSI
jgi:hypothetical protein